jgi:ketosteroid isomerase-like protein
MSSKNVETLRKCHEAFSAHNFDEAMKLVAPTSKVIDHGRGQTFNSRQEFRGWLEAFTAMSSDIKLVDARYIDGGDYVTATFRGVGTQDGAMAGTPFGASGKPFSLDVCEVWHFNADGEAIEGHNYSDGLGLLMQLGHMPAPA